MEHEIDVSHKLLGGVVMLRAPLVESCSDDGQVDRPLDDLVVMTSLHHEISTFDMLTLTLTYSKISSIHSSIDWLALSRTL